MVRRKQIALDYVHIERNDIEESGDYDLEGLFVRLGHAIDSVGAKRVVLDTIESLFGGLSNQAVLRAEIRRLFQWLKDRGITAVITGERGEATLTRQGLEEYVSDCVILLDHRVVNQVSTRRIRVVKYRGSTHGTNEYPFLIDEDGISVLPITSLGLAHTASRERISTGIPALDEMLGGQGCFRGNSILVSGTAGTGKTTVAASFANAACGRGERTLYFAFEESQTQIVRNMRSVGIDLERWTENGLLRFMATRPSFYGLEMHLATMHKAIDAVSTESRRHRPDHEPHAGRRARRRADHAAAPGGLPQGAPDHRRVHQPDACGDRASSKRPRSASAPSWTRGFCCATSSWPASAIAVSTSSSRAA